MDMLYVLMMGMTAVILFVFGLENFSQEMERISGDQLRRSLSKATQLPVIGLIIGALVTAVIQSSSATSVIAVSLVNAGIISFKNSLGIIFGANIGTTITAQLVAFKLTSFAPIFIIVGFMLSLVRARYSIFGKTIFYFGFVFFSLNLISSSLAPLQQNETLISLLTQPQNPLLGIFFGFLFTAIVQSSSVTTGLAIVFAQQGLLSLENAVPLIMGANVGSTATAFLAVLRMEISAKKTALSHFLFNLGGVLIFLPCLYMFDGHLRNYPGDPAIALASIHLVFNVATSLIFLLLVERFARLVDWLLGEGKTDFERLRIPKVDQEGDFKAHQLAMEQQMPELLSFLQESYNLVTLSIESNYTRIHDTADKRIEYINFVKKEYQSYFSHIVTEVGDEEESQALIDLIARYDYLFQVHDSIKDMFETRKIIVESYIELQSDILVLIREISSEILGFFDDVLLAIKGEDIDLKASARSIHKHLNQMQKTILALVADPARSDAGALTNFATYSVRLKDKLINFAKFEASVPQNPVREEALQGSPKVDT